MPILVCQHFVRTERRLRLSPHRSDRVRHRRHEDWVDDVAVHPALPRMPVSRMHRPQILRPETEMHRGRPYVSWSSAEERPEMTGAQAVRHHHTGSRRYVQGAGEPLDVFHSAQYLTLTVAGSCACTSRSTGSAWAVGSVCRTLRRSGAAGVGRAGAWHAGGLRPSACCHRRDSAVPADRVWALVAVPPEAPVRRRSGRLRARRRWSGW